MLTTECSQPDKNFRVKPYVSLIIPVFNEIGRLESCVQSFIGALQDLGVDFEIIMAEEGSTEGSDKIVKKLKDTKYMGLLKLW